MKLKGFVSLLNILRGYSIIMFALRGGGDPSKWDCMQTGGMGLCQSECSHITGGGELCQCKHLHIHFFLNLVPSL